MASKSLLADAESRDDALVTIKVLALEVVQQPAAFADHLDQSEARVIVLRVRPEVIGQLLDALGEDSDLDFRGACVRIVGSVIVDEVRLASEIEGHRQPPPEPSSFARAAQMGELDD